MSAGVTLATVLATIRRRADIISMTARHPDADLVVDINDSWQALREKVSEAGGGFYLKPTTITTMTVGLATGSTGGSIPWPTGATRIYGIDLYVTSSDIRVLAPIGWHERANTVDMFGQNAGPPRGFAVGSVGDESTTSVGAGVIYLYPAPDKAYQYVIWYVPTWTPIAAANTTYVFNGVAGWDEWVVWDVACKVFLRDGFLDKMQMAEQMREKVWTERILAATRTQRALPTKRIDVAAINRRQNYAPYWRTR